MSQVKQKEKEKQLLDVPPLKDSQNHRQILRNLTQLIHQDPDDDENPASKVPGVFHKPRRLSVHEGILIAGQIASVIEEGSSSHCNDDVEGEVVEVESVLDDEEELFNLHLRKTPSKKYLQENTIIPNLDETIQSKYQLSNESVEESVPVGSSLSEEEKYEFTSATVNPEFSDLSSLHLSSVNEPIDPPVEERIPHLPPHSESRNEEDVDTRLTEEDFSEEFSSIDGSDE